MPQKLPTQSIEYRLRSALFRTRPGKTRIREVRSVCRDENVLKVLILRDNSGYTLLAQAALKFCEFEVLECLVRAGASLRSRENHGRGLLSTMLVNHHPQAIKDFLLLGADWSEESNGECLLWQAIKIQEKNSKRAQLIAQAFDVIVHGHPGGTQGAAEHRDYETGKTALHIASIEGNTTVAKQLLVWGAEVDAQDRAGHTPLWEAAAHGQVDSAMLLINAGAKVDSKGKEGSTPLRVASRNGGVGKKTKARYVEMVALLLAQGAQERKAGLTNSEAVGATQQALTVAKSGADRLASSLSQLDAAHPITGRTALHEAAYRGDYEAVCRLIELGAEINSRDLSGMTPMDLAVYRNDYRDKTPPSSSSKHSKSKLSKVFSASSCEELGRHLERIAAMFVDLGSDLGTESQARQLIWTAASVGWHQFIDSLTTHPKPGQSCQGALGQQVLKSGPHWHDCPAIWIATQRNYLLTVKILMKAGSKVDAFYSLESGDYVAGPWLRAVVPSHGDKGRLSLKQGDGTRKVPSRGLIGGEEVWLRGTQKVRPRFMPPPDGTTSVHQAAMNGHYDILRLLLKKTKNLDMGCVHTSADLEGNTPLHYAALAGWHSCCVLLIEAGANIEARNQRKLTPLLSVLTCETSTRGEDENKASREEICLLLVKLGANIQPVDWLGRSARQLAAERAISLTDFNKYPSRRYRTSSTKCSTDDDNESAEGSKKQQPSKESLGPPDEAKLSPEAFSAWINQEASLVVLKS